ncbi:MAG: hypothetical protein IPL52_03270 [Flavobacteriales bacterium]|nr:hypothetical protein [Flavobacteriales bacterium]
MNLNFDELLDNALEDELGEGTYRTIHPSSLPQDIAQIIASDRLRIPIYVKPHGTASIRNSMMYTRRGYAQWPQQMRNVFRDLMEGRIDSSPAQGRSKRPLDIADFNLMSVGYFISGMDIREELFNQLESRKPHPLFHIQL